MAATTIKLFGYKKCSTCRKAEKSLEALGVDYQFIDITENPPSASALKKIAKLAAVEPKKLFNTSGVQYRELKIKDQLPQLSQEDIFSLLAGNGRLIKRPLTTDNGRATVGFKEDIFEQTWG